MITQAIILCGGKGTRLSTLYSDRPKILVPIAGRPFIEWQLEWLGHQGVTDIHLAAGYKANVLQEWLVTRSQEAGDKRQEEDSRFVIRQSAFSCAITLSAEPSPLGTGGGLRHVLPWLRSNPFLVLNGDSLVPHLRVAELLETHRRDHAAATIAVTRIEKTGRYGTVEFDSSGHITAFQEKTDRENGWVNGGVYALSQDILQEIPAGQPVSMETELFPALATRGIIKAVPCQPPLLDMGTPEGIAAMESYLLKRQDD